jgi:type VI secretion system protein ImpE
MTATDLFKAGKLDEAVAAQLQEVKAHPGDHGKRLFLFELLAFSGDWERARRQLEVVKYDDVQLEAATQAYANLVKAEEKRQLVFRDGTPPQFLAEPPAHVKPRLEALNWLLQGKQAEAARALTEADTLAPLLGGQLNGKPFEGLRDGDDLLGVVLEVMAHGNYFWVPLDQVELLSTNPPRFPRDLLWLPAHMETAGAAGEVFLPTLYPGSSGQTDPQVRLGRMTDWKQEPGGPIRGLGSKTFLAGEEAVTLLDWRQLQLNLTPKG